MADKDQSSERPKFLGEEQVGDPTQSESSPNAPQAFAPEGQRHQLGEKPPEEPPAVPLDTPPTDAVSGPSADNSPKSTVDSSYAASELPEMDASLAPTGFQLPRGFHVISAAAVTLVLGLVLLVLLSQAMTFFQAAAMQPAPIRWLTYGAGTLLLVAVAGASGVLLIAYLRLRRTPAISRSALAQLRQRQDLQRAAGQRAVRARHELKQLLDEMPMDAATARGKARCDELLKLGASEDQVEDLQNRHRQLSEASNDDPQSWIHDFDRLFLSTLDELAKGRIKHHALAVSWKTAAAPTGFFDAAIVLINSYILIADLCRIYRVRATRWGTVQILARVLFNVFIASQAEDITAELGDSIGQSLKGVAGNLLGSLLSQVSGPVAQGTANGFFLSRLGLRARRMLRPVAIETL
jgi:uncharacterized membrane protein YcjF (UPF0283 family)